MHTSLIKISILLLSCCLLTTAVAEEEPPVRYIPPPPPADAPKYDPNNLLTFPELPLALQRELPEMNLELLLYNQNPEERRVRISGQSGHEGLPIGREVWIHEIRKDGVVIRYWEGFFLLEP